ncbi:hypothetical protein LTR64_002092 [Lithohypha guttulata]|uniref:uncharacterized protein n=1 Tax=Lithohypha guttulata TaxID=1690604 RepID=UPI002DDFC5FA|nr:hypothetical protein LTR51_007950 [Lithohypha guttulata]
MEDPHAPVHPASSPPLLPSAQTFDSPTDVFDSEPSPSRQQRLLQTRNARFPAKKLSISSLSSKLTQLIGNNEQSEGPASPARNKENRLHKSKSTGTIGKRGGLGILDEISNATRGRSIRRHRDISIYQDHPERPLLETSPLAASSPYVDPKADFTSPLAFDHIQDSISNMRLRELSYNEAWSPAVKSPPSIRLKQRKPSAQIQFDAEEYIEHIEKELQRVRDEAFSPLTRRPLKEKLRVATKENDRLQKELATLKEKFETEVKRTVEHKTIVEVELKRKVRDLEDSLEEKDNALRELQYQHEEKRLDTNVIETLKAQIDKLEQDKTDLEEINLGMTKRNEVLTQLLAMSPTKSATVLTSPVREKRNPRPLSLIIPRLPSSPKQFNHGTSLTCSPRLPSSTDISPLKLSPEQRDGYISSQELQQNVPDLDRANKALRSPLLQAGLSRRWTILSDASASSNNVTEENRPATRRKARKFVAGSTQLKPLLLSTMTGDASQPASALSSPRSWATSQDHDFGHDETIMPTEQEIELENRQSGDTADEELIAQVGEEGPGPDYVHNESERQPSSDEYDILQIDGENTVAEQSMSNTIRQRQSQMVCASPQTMPMPSTPDSLAALPRPLFSPARRDITVSTHVLMDQLSSLSPAISSCQGINLRKRRKTSPASIDLGSPVSKIARHRARHFSVRRISLPSISPETRVQKSPAPHQPTLSHQLRNIRSTDNVAQILRRKDFAVKPLAALTIQTVYKILSTCTSVIRDLRRDPFAVVRRVLANAWYMNWDLLGKLSWWVLGLFVYPRAAPRTRPAIDWDQYDGESIASRYCSEVGDEEEQFVYQQAGYNDDKWPLHNVQSHQGETKLHLRNGLALVKQERPGWAKSLFLWGKFSAVMMLAVSGAVIKGPGEMLKDVQRRSVPGHPRHRACKSCGGALHENKSRQSEREGVRGTTILQDQHEGQQFTQSTPHQEELQFNSTPQARNAQYLMSDRNFTRRDRTVPDTEFDFRSDTQLDSSSILEQLQQLSASGCDSTLRPRESPRRRVTSLFPVESVSPCVSVEGRFEQSHDSGI